MSIANKTICHQQQNLRVENIINSVLRRPDTHGSYVTTFMSIESTEISIPSKN